MIFIAGLGNPGRAYENTRHNVGFVVLDRLAKKLDASFSLQSKFKGEVAKVGQIVLIKPQTFMNDSGSCVRSVIQFYDKELLTTDSMRSLFVVHDDLDLQLGTHKLVVGSGPKAHNGVNSVRESVGSSDFTYVRIGVDNRAPGFSGDPSDYVLSPFIAEEKPILEQVLEQVIDQLYAQIHS